jgi:hypothetical protein
MYKTKNRKARIVSCLDGKQYDLPLCAPRSPRANDALRRELANDDEGTKRASVSWNME